MSSNLEVPEIAPLHIDLVFTDEVAVELELVARQKQQPINEIVRDLLKAWAFEQYCKGESHA